MRFDYDPEYAAELDIEREITRDLCRTEDGRPGLFGAKLQPAFLRVQASLTRKPMQRFPLSIRRAGEKSAA